MLNFGAPACTGARSSKTVRKVKIENRVLMQARPPKSLFLAALKRSPLCYQSRGRTPTRRDIYIHVFLYTYTEPTDTRPVTPSYTTACKARLCVSRWCIREFHLAFPQIVLGPGGHRIWNIRLIPTDSDLLDRFVKMKMIAGSASIVINRTTNEVLYAIILPWLLSLLVLSAKHASLFPVKRSSWNNNWRPIANVDQWLTQSHHAELTMELLCTRTMCNRPTPRPIPRPRRREAPTHIES